jgi:hypothetical protein
MSCANRHALAVVAIVTCAAALAAAAAAAEPVEQAKPGADARVAQAPTTQPVDAAAILARTLPEIRLERVPLTDVMDALRDLTGGNFSLNDAALAAVGVKRATPVTFQGEKVSLGQILEGMLNPLADRGVTYRADKETIYVSTKADLDHLDAFRERHAELLASPQLANARLAVKPQELHGPGRRLKDVLATVSRESGMTIQADMDKLAQVGVTGRQVIRLQGRNPTLADALTQALWHTGRIDELDLKVEGNTITVIPREKPKAA